MERIKIEGLEYWLISEDGQVKHQFSGKYKKPVQNNCGYFQYHFTNFKTNEKKWLKIHRLVAITYIGSPPTPKHEINHKDGNKGNNHYSNLEWVTHSENILKSYREQGRKSYWKGLNKPSPGLETRMLMANAKFKRIRAIINGESKEFSSISDTCKFFNWYRKKFNRIMNKGGMFYNNGIEIELSYID
jgi:hypothetical protein